MPLVIELTPEDTARVISAVEESSVLLERSDFESTSTNSNKTFRTLSLGDAKHHTPGGADKTEGNDSLETLEVPLESFYKWVTFHDIQADDDRAVVAKVVQKLPGTLALTFDKDGFGDEFDASNPFPALTTNKMAVDETSASWQAAKDSISDAGFNPDTVLLTNQAKTLLKNAYVEDANTNTLRDGNVAQIDGADVFFRALRTGAAVEGDLIGVIYDQTQLVTAAKEEIETDYYSRRENASLRAKNLDAVYAGTQMGMKLADNDAAVYLYHTTVTP